MGQGITPGAEPSIDGQKELEEFGEDGVGHLRALSPWCMMIDDDDPKAFKLEMKAIVDCILSQ